MQRRSLFASLILASTLAGAQLPPGSAPPRIDVAALLNLDASRAAQVDAILKSAHERMASARELAGHPTDDASRATLRAAMKAIREDTDRQLSAVLSAEEIAKLHEAMPKRPDGPWKRM
jgi:hypothetical protein